MSGEITPPVKLGNCILKLSTSNRKRDLSLHISRHVAVDFDSVAAAFRRAFLTLDWSTHRGA